MRESPSPLSSPPVTIRVVSFLREQQESDFIALWWRDRVAKQVNSFDRLLVSVGASFQNATCPSVAVVIITLLSP